MDNKDNQKIKDAVKGYIFMLLGCIAYGASTSLFLAPNAVVAGGVTGLAVTVNILLPVITVGIAFIAINVPILLMGLKMQGWKFILRCLITVVVLGWVTDGIEHINKAIQGEALPITSDPILACVYGGICQGIGIGLFVKFQFSSGGTELLARVIAKLLKGISIPIVLGVLDGIIVIVGSIVTKNINNIFYALIVVFLSAKISEIVLFGLDKSKLCIVISDKGREISQTLIEKSPRGVTMLKGEGMYTHNEHEVLLTCVKNNQLTQLKEIIYGIDKKAFIIINESIEVRGQGFKSLGEDVEDAVNKAKKQAQEQQTKESLDGELQTPQENKND